MRYFCCLVSLYLLQTVTGVVDFARDEIIKKNEVLNSGKPVEVPVDKLREKREAHVHARRGQRQVGFFETSGENLCENEFVTQDVRGPGIRDDEKLDNDFRFGQGLYEQDRQNAGAPESNANIITREAYRNPKFHLFHSEDELDLENNPNRKERQADQYKIGDDILRGPDKPEVNKKFINLLRWNKNKETISDLFPPGIQKNEIYPVNDDIADFATYMNKTFKKKTKTKNDIYQINRDGYSDQNEDNELSPDYSSSVKRKPVNSEENLPEDNYLDNGLKVKKYAENNLDDFLFQTDDTNNWEKAKSNSQKRPFNPYGPISVGSLVKNEVVNANEDEVDSPESVDRPRDDSSSSVVGDVVREKTIILPEPLVFNSSHVVASFVYTMIPFRSPLLNLLENDKHSKYIMIKIDPVLQQSKRSGLLEPQLMGDNIEYTLEKNVMRVIDKLIGSNFQWDFTQVEGIPRSKQNYKNMKSRYFRESDDQNTLENRPSSPIKIKHFNGVIS